MTQETKDNKELYEELDRLRRQVSQLQREKDAAQASSNAKSEYLANMSHELRTPLNTIIGVSELILHNEISEKQRGDVENILHMGKELLGNLNDILDLSKIEANRFELFEEQYDLCSILDDAYTLCIIRLSGRPVDFRIIIRQEIPRYFIGDAHRIREIIMNLLSNAIKYTNEGSIQLVIDIDRNKADSCDLKFTVEDTGVGIKEEGLAVIFESYMQADAKRDRTLQGTGLGLAITKRLTELMGGSISVKSKYGIGSSFYVVLPQRYAGEETLCDQEYRPKVLAQNGGEGSRKPEYPDAQVLIIDDMKVNLIVAAEVFKGYGISADTAICGDDGIMLIKQKKYDIVFMDHLMPGMDGVETLNAIRALGEEYAELPVVAMTANLADDSRFFIEKGFNGYIAKPVDGHQLEEILGMYLGASDIRNELIESAQEMLGCNLQEVNFDMLRACGIVPEDGMRSAGVDTEFYISMLASFMESFKGCDFAELARTDLDIFRIKVHGVKGVALALGANSLALEAKLLEKSLDDKDDNAVTKQLPVFLRCYTQVCNGIADFLGTYGL